MEGGEVMERLACAEEGEGGESRWSWRAFSGKMGDLERCARVLASEGPVRGGVNEGARYAIRSWTWGRRGGRPVVAEGLGDGRRSAGVKLRKR